MAVQPMGALVGPVQNMVGARQANGAQAANAVNTQIQAYLNPGAWTGGRTGFGLVSRNEVYACSLETHPEGVSARVRGERVTAIRGPYSQLRSKLISTNKNDTTHPAQKFLLQAVATFPNLYIFGRYEADNGFQGFTAANDLLVFIPDMHMNLFRQMPIDGFTKPRQGFPGARDSQVQQLVAFLDFIDNFSQNAGCNVTLVQLGDLVDTWHAQSIFLQAHMYLHQKDLEYQKAHGAGMTSYDYYYHPNNLLISETPQPQYTKRTVTYANWPAQANAFDAWVLMALNNKLPKLSGSKSKHRHIPLPMHLLNVNVNYTLRTSIENTIMSNAVYPEMSAGRNRWPQLTANWVRGNHDMDMDHPWLGNGALANGWQGAADRFQFAWTDDYWSTKPVPQQRDKWRLRDDKPCTLLAQSAAGYGVVLGRQGCVWYEHGHAFDSYNHRSTWYREEKRPAKKDARIRLWRPQLRGGFMCTLGFVNDACKYFIEKGGLFFEISEVAGDLGLEFYSYERAHRIFTLHGGQAPPGGQGPIHLVVLGHTHIPHIEDYAKWNGKWVAVDVPWITG